MVWYDFGFETGMDLGDTENKVKAGTASSMHFHTKIRTLTCLWVFSLFCNSRYTDRGIPV